MLLLVSFAAIITAYIVSRLYADDNNRLPPASTPRGKQARVVLCGILVLIVVLLVLNFVGEDLNATQLLFWVVVLSLAAGLPVFRYLGSKNKK